MTRISVNLTLLTALFMGLCVPTKIGTSSADAREQFWLDATTEHIGESGGYVMQSRKFRKSQL